MLWNRWFIKMGRFLLKERLVKINNSLCWNSNIWLSVKVIARQCKVRGWSSANAGHHPLPQWPQNAPNIAMGPWVCLLPWNRRVELLPNQSGEAAGCSGPKKRTLVFSWHDPRHDITVLYCVYCQKRVIWFQMWQRYCQFASGHEELVDLVLAV